MPSEIFPARRVRWVMQRIFEQRHHCPSAALDPPDYGRKDWWQHEKALLDFRTRSSNTFTTESSIDPSTASGLKDGTRPNACNVGNGLSA